MVLNNPARVTATLGMAFGGPAFSETTIGERSTVVRGSIRARVEAWYQDQGNDLCRGFQPHHPPRCWAITIVRLIVAPLALGAILAGQTKTQLLVGPDSPEENKAMVRRFFEAQNKADIQHALDEVAVNATDEGNPLPGGARGFFQSEMEDLRHTFPDWHAEIVDLVAERDTVVALCRVTGTHQGVGRLPLYGNLLTGRAPTGKRFDVAHIYWFTLKSGKIVDRRFTRDDVGMYKQLGVLPNGVVSETSTRLAAGTRISSVTPSHRDRTVETRNKGTVARFFEAQNRGDVRTAFGLTAGGFNERIAAAFADILHTFPDWHWKIIDTVAEGDAVVTMALASGTHLGVARFPLNGGLMVGAEPTGKHFEALHIHWATLRDGKMAQDDRTRDDIGMTRQLGLLPPAN
jgi:predicted ester cyclase